VTQYADFLLLVIVAIDLYIVASNRLFGCIRSTAVQGVALALLPFALYGTGGGLHVAFLATGTLVVKALLIPYMLARTLRQANIAREIEPFLFSVHVSVLIGAVLVVISFWFASVLVIPHPERLPTTLLVPVAFATLLLGFLVLVSRKKALTQVIGYLMLENGIYVFGQTLLDDVPFAVELGILLDLLVGVFVMGIAINHISREFDHVDTELLSSLKD
jgi:hydrogenase-4 component E